MTGSFIISLDFELHWGVSDHRSVESYHENLRNVPEVVRRLLAIFRKREIHATWATVGMLFCRDKDELLNTVTGPNRPVYKNKSLSNYEVAINAGLNESDDPFHYAGSLIREVIATPHQELGTHTFSHFYCLEQGQTDRQFGYDLAAARKMIEREGVNAVSIVFPRNQYDNSYLQQCYKHGFCCYRGNYPSSIYRPEAKTAESFWKRVARMTDAYLPLTGHRWVTPEVSNGMVNVPASCFLRPFNRKLSVFEPIRLSRIKREMTVTARRKSTYHLWWHPHNFGKEMERNFRNLEIILDHFQKLSADFGMQSLNMGEVYEQYRQR